jgi:hypothetical protein
VDCLFSLRTSPGTVALANEKAATEPRGRDESSAGVFGEPEQYEAARAL